MRLIDYESRMSKIRQKNQEKLSELRRKLDAQLGVGGKGGTKGGREKKGKEDGGGNVERRERRPPKRRKGKEK